MYDLPMMILAAVCVWIAWAKDRRDTSSAADAAPSPQGEGSAGEARK